MRGIDCIFSFTCREKRWSRMVRLPSIPTLGVYVEIVPLPVRTAARVVASAIVFHRIENLKKVNPLAYAELELKDVEPAELEKWGWKCES